METRQQLAAQYDFQRQQTIAAFDRHGHGSSAHKTAVRLLASIARALHDAEIAAGVPVGSTRKGECR